MFRVLSLSLILCFAAPLFAGENVVLLPAGTLLRCTLDEPRLSSQTVKVDDPVLCRVNPLRLFGSSAFPRGAYLVGRFAAYRDPGHFFGKGWLELAFNSLVLPDRAVPLSARVISADRLTVDRDGRVHGRGHPHRDALEWAIPPLWPVKVLTLPLRGPRPELKGEVRITLRLLEDIDLPTAVNTSSTDAPRKREMSPATLREPNTLTRKLRYVGSSWPALATADPIADFQTVTRQADVAPFDHAPEQASSAGRLTVVILKDAPGGYVVTDYWVEADELHCTTPDGRLRSLPLETIDLAASVRLNHERGVEFVLRSRSEP